MPTGYEEIYLNLIPRLSECNFAESAERLGLECTKEGNIRVSFLGREYRITKQGAYAVDGKTVNVNNQSVLLYYVLSKGSGKPGNSYAPLLRLTGMPEGQNPGLQNIMNDPLVREFGNDYERFCMAAAKLGGVCEAEGIGKHEWLFQLLPTIPVKVVYYEADEEFPPETQIMMDETAPRFLDFECLAFLTGCFVRAMIKAAAGIYDFVE